MYTIKVIKRNDQRTFEEVFQCKHYKRELIDQGKDSFEHYLDLYGVEHFEDGVQIDLHNMEQDQFGKYNQTVYIMNDNGKTIDRY